LALFQAETIHSTILLRREREQATVVEPFTISTESTDQSSKNNKTSTEGIRKQSQKNRPTVCLTEDYPWKAAKRRGDFGKSLGPLAQQGPQASMSFRAQAPVE
jgi:hypothetical protein